MIAPPVTGVALAAGDSRGPGTRELDVDGPVPLDVDVWEDCRRPLDSVAP